MGKLKVGIIDLVTKGPTRALYARVMNANLASIMPQVVAVWCEAEGHDVTFVCYTGFENLVEELPAIVDLVFIGAFTEAALPRLLAQQPVPLARSGHRPRRAPRALLSRGRAEVLRLRPRLHRSQP